MCGRFAITSPPEAVRAYFRYAEQPNFPPRYNIAPTQPIPVVRLADGTTRQYGAVPPKGAVIRVERYRTGGGRKAKNLLQGRETF
mgnify:CR=1 FL=1